MAWIESHQSLLNHRKTGRLARALGISKITAIGHLHVFWWWCLDNAPDGNLTGIDAEDIAEGAGWEGDPAEFIKALHFAGFLDDGEGVHDWYEYAGKLIEGRKANAERMRRKRAAHDSTGSNDSAAHVQHTNGARAEHVQGLPYSTVPYSTNNVVLKSPTITPVPDPPAADAALSAAEQEPPRLRAVPKEEKPKQRGRSEATVPGWDYPGLWRLVEQELGYKPTWNYATETNAVNEILRVYPNEEPQDLVRFLCYRRTAFGVAKGAQVCFSATKQHYGAWVADDRPERSEPRNPNSNSPQPVTTGRRRDLKALVDEEDRRFFGNNDRAGPPAAG
jgi:hypothetical protein